MCSLVYQTLELLLQPIHLRQRIGREPFHGLTRVQSNLFTQLHFLQFPLKFVLLLFLLMPQLVNLHVSLNLDLRLELGLQLVELRDVGLEGLLEGLGLGSGRRERLVGSLVRVEGAVSLRDGSGVDVRQLRRYQVGDELCLEMSTRRKHALTQHLF